jgi:hypothetical protein
MIRSPGEGSLRGVRLLAFLILPILSAPMAAQDSPTATVRSAFDALANRNWSALGSLVDSKALESLRQDALGMLILTSEQRLAGEKVGGGYNPDEVVITEHLPRVGSQAVTGFRDHPTIAKLASLSPKEFFIEWAEAAYGPQDDPVREVVGLYRRIIGDVEQSAETSYVLYRRESRHADMTGLHVNLPGRVMIVPVVRTGDGWRIKFNDDIGWSIDFSHVVFPERRYRSPKMEKPRPTLPPEPPAPSPERIASSPSPVQVAESAFAAFKSQNWSALAELVHPAVLRSFQQEQLSFLAVWGRSRETQAGIPRESAQVIMYSYEDSLRPETLAQVANIEIPIFAEHRRIGELAVLSPADFFQAWCRAAYGTPGENIGAWKGALDRETIGQLFEGDSLAHVLYRTPRLYLPDRMPLKWSDSGWRIMLNDDIGWSGDLDLERLNR